MAVINMSVVVFLSRAITARSSGGGVIRGHVLGKRSTGFIGPCFASFNSATRHHSPRPQHPSHRRSSNSRPSAYQPLESTSHSPPDVAAAASEEPFKINLLTLPLSELETLLQSWNYPPFRARQIHNWIFHRGIHTIDQMTDLPLPLRTALRLRTTLGSLRLHLQQTSSDGTIKRAYRLHDGQIIESVLMPYRDGRRTACISSQAGCAMGCVFCATGQMGFARQLTADEIFEQVARFANELTGRGERLSNVVLMGMGEPLANYRNVVAAIRRMNVDLGIGARRITVSTVGVVPNIRKLMGEDLNVRLAVSLHCATDEERTALLPANRRYGGLDELMTAVREFVLVKKQRVTFEWALIEGQNDSKEVARSLGRLLRKYDIRPDMAHVNLIPLNPTGGYGGSPSGRASVQNFVDVLENEFGISATPRMRRGIDIDAGCGQLKSSIKKKEDAEKSKDVVVNSLPVVGVYEDAELLEPESISLDSTPENSHNHGSIVEFTIDDAAVDLDDEEDAENFIDPVYENEFDLSEADRLIALVKGTSLSLDEDTLPPEPSEADRLIALVQGASLDEAMKDSSLSELHDLIQPERPKTKSTTITDAEAIREAKRRRKKLLKNLKAVQKLRDIEASGKILNEEQREKVAKETEWIVELESVEHNLM
ncbi:hypothetical protein ACHAW6_015934 [Cyclotella cf. meneghiniana]